MQYFQFFAINALTGATLPSATAAIYVADTFILATLFDVSGVAISNPTTASSDGLVSFATADGIYDVYITSGSYTAPTIKRLQVLDANLVKNRVSALEATQSTNALAYQSWTVLSATAGTYNGQPAQVWNAGNGSHVDPVMPTTAVITFTNGSPTVHFSAPPDWVGGIINTLTTTGTLPTNFATGTVYYLQNYNPSTGDANLSATPTGSPITAGSAGSGTHTAHQAVVDNGVYTRTGASTWRWLDANAMNLKANKSISITGLGLATGGGDLNADRAITVTPSTDAQAVTGANATTVLTPHTNAVVLRKVRTRVCRVDYAAPFMLCSIGDSIIALNDSVGIYTIGPTTYQQVSTLSSGEVGWAWRTAPYFNHDIWYDAADPNSLNFNGANRGVGGNTCDQVIARLSQVLDQPCDGVFVAVGINDLTAGDAATTIFPKIQTIINRITATGRWCFIGNIRPVGTTGIVSWTAGDARRTQLANLNTSIAAYGVPTTTPNARAILVDLYTAYRDPGNPGFPLANTLADGIHPTSYGAQLGGAALELVMRKVIKGQIAFPDIFSNNYLPNPLLAGSGGTVSLGVTGVVADGWQAFRNGAGNCTAVANVVAIGDGQQAQELIFTTAGANTAEAFVFELGTGTFSDDVDLGGQWVRIGAKIQTDTWTGWRNVEVALENYCKDGLSTEAAPILNTGSTMMRYYLSPPKLMPASPGAVQPLIVISINPAAAGTGRAVIHQFGLFVYPSPRIVRRFALDAGLASP